eukprot:TRINITY_DN12370_c1_g2_i1.p1 TRINITY_DN12370_c1_g2~~TRINITY_DN12370_c1_g2_i1.p1  ORF type:complete len:1122 (+),score=274.82 TRINITY_DN12370_c1_g2_i1:66-3431(+)
MAPTVRQAVSELRSLAKQIDTAAREAGPAACPELLEWCSGPLLLLLRWLGDPSEADQQLSPSAPWLRPTYTDIPVQAPDPHGGQSDEAEAAAALPGLLRRLRDELAGVFAPGGLTLQPRRRSTSAGGPRTRRPRAPVVNRGAHHPPAPSSLVLDDSVAAAWTQRKTAVERSRYAVLCALRRVRRRQLRCMRSSLLLSLRDPSAKSVSAPVPVQWGRPLADSGVLKGLEVPCRAVLEAFPEADDPAEASLRLCMFAQVGCDTADRQAQDSESEDDSRPARARGQWESYSIRVSVEASPTAEGGFGGLELVLSPLQPTCCVVTAIRHTWPDAHPPNGRDDGALTMRLPSLAPGERHDVLALGEVRAVGLTELSFDVGPRPWGTDEQRLVARAAAAFAGVSEKEVRIVSVGEPDRGVASVTLAFPQARAPRDAQRSLLQAIRMESAGMPFRVKSARPQIPTNSDVSVQLRFRFRDAAGDDGDDDDGDGSTLRRTVSFSKTADIGDCMSAEVSLSERWGFHSARVREEVFRHNICTILDLLEEQDVGDNAQRWRLEVRRILSSHLYDHPLSQLRDTKLMRELLWAANGGTVDIQDPAERTAVAASVRHQRCVLNPRPRNACRSRRHTVYADGGGLPPAVRALHDACVVFHNELVRIEQSEEQLARSVAALPPPSPASTPSRRQAPPAEVTPPAEPTRGITWQSPSPSAAADVEPATQTSAPPTAQPSVQPAAGPPHPLTSPPHVPEPRRKVRRRRESEAELTRRASTTARLRAEALAATRLPRPAVPQPVPGQRRHSRQQRQPAARPSYTPRTGYSDVSSPNGDGRNGSRQIAARARAGPRRARGQLHSPNPARARSLSPGVASCTSKTTDRSSRSQSSHYSLSDSDVERRQRRGTGHLTRSSVSARWDLQTELGPAVVPGRVARASVREPSRSSSVSPRLRTWLRNKHHAEEALGKGPADSTPPRRLKAPYGPPARGWSPGPVKAGDRAVVSKDHAAVVAAHRSIGLSTPDNVPRMLGRQCVVDRVDYDAGLASVRFASADSRSPRAAPRIPVALLRPMSPPPPPRRAARFAALFAAPASAIAAAAATAKVLRVQTRPDAAPRVRRSRSADRIQRQPALAPSVG